MEEYNNLQTNLRKIMIEISEDELDLENTFLNG